MSLSPQGSLDDGVVVNFDWRSSDVHLWELPWGGFWGGLTEAGVSSTIPWAWGLPWIRWERESQLNPELLPLLLTHWDMSRQPPSPWTGAAPATCPVDRPPALIPSQDEPLLPEVLCVRDSVAVAREETNEGLNISHVPIILEFLWCLQFCLSCSQQWQWIGPSGGSRMLFWVYSVVRFLLSSCFWHEQSPRAEKHAGKGHGYRKQNIDCSAVGAVGGGGVRPHMG